MTVLVTSCTESESGGRDACHRNRTPDAADARQPEPGGAVLQPRTAGHRAVRARPPDVRGMRTVDPVPDDEQGVRRQHDSGRADRLHVCREQLVSVHAVQRALGAHADRQRRQLHGRRRRRVRGDDSQGQVEGRRFRTSSARRATAARRTSASRRSRARSTGTTTA